MSVDEVTHSCQGGVSAQDCQHTAQATLAALAD